MPMGTDGFLAGDQWASYAPGSDAPASGIYRCEGCGQEVTVMRQRPLPPANHHKHASLLSIRWRLVVKQEVH
ncbi:protein L [Pseudomonas sp. NPDC007930]|uniref:protein L n=1 Tax=Pseudomonas sp. NPDC007930 TaxID=3364417 RepID=UPI0036E1EE15